MSLRIDALRSVRGRSRNHILKGAEKQIAISADSSNRPACADAAVNYVPELEQWALLSPVQTIWFVPLLGIFCRSVQVSKTDAGYGQAAHF
jgi:hypothetical protein